jgi:hypothetical protein
MVQEEKELLLKDLCARLPYEVICQMEDKLIINDSQFYDYTLSERHINLIRNHKNFYIKPYLRPLSSMTDEEREEYGKVCELDTEILANHPMNGEPFPALYNSQDWLNKKMFDFRGLIPKGLALEAPEGMYLT